MIHKLLDIKRLDKWLALEHLQDILKIEKSAHLESPETYPDYWKEEHFLYELPEKWTYSRIIFDGSKPVGFYISSQKVISDGTKVLHGHRVAIDKEIRDPQLLLKVYESMFKEARSNQLKYFTGHQADHHPIMLMWNLRVMKCKVIKTIEEAEYFLGKFPSSGSIQPNGLIDFNGDEIEYYLIIKSLLEN